VTEPSNDISIDQEFRSRHEVPSKPKPFQFRLRSLFIATVVVAVLLGIGRIFGETELFGAVFGFKVLRVGHVGSPIAQGLSMGTATHAVGTSTAMEISGKYGAYASLGLTLNGIMTAIFTPTILRLLGVI